MFQLKNLGKEQQQDQTEPTHPHIDPMIRKKESEFWHAKALDVAISFLPSESPLVTHILTSYQKHHAPVQQEIVIVYKLNVNSPKMRRQVTDSG